MIEVRQQSAVIDRIVDGVTAVLLLEEEQKEFLCSVDELPIGSAEGIWLAVKIKNGRLVEAKLDLKKTREMRSRIRAKLARLRRRMQTRR